MCKYSAQIKQHILTLVIVFAIGFAPAMGSNSPKTLTLNDYVQIAQKNNVDIHAAFHRWKAAEERIIVAKGLPNPTLSFGYFLENVETAVGPQEYKIGVLQKFPWFGKRKTQGEIQSARTEILFQQLQAKRLTVIHAVKSTWYDYYYLMRAISITRQNYDLVLNWETVVRSKYMTARAGHPDLIKTQIERIQLEDKLKSLEAKQFPILEKFRSLLNDHDLADITVTDSLEFIPNEFSTDEIIRSAKKDNPGVLSAEQGINMNGKTLKRTKLNWYPDIGIGLDYIGTGSKVSSAESGKDPLFFKVGLDLPIWFGKTKKSIQSAKLELDAATYHVESVINQLAVDIETTIFELENAERRVQLYKESLIPKSLESLSVTEKAYIADKVDLLTLIDAQRRHLAFTLNYEQALVQYLKSSSKLNTLTGTVEKGR